MSIAKSIHIFDLSATHLLKTDPVLTLLLDCQQITAEQLIIERVKAEVEHLKQQVSQPSYLLDIDEKEAILNAKKPKQWKVCIDSQCEKAITAFKANAFLMIVDGEQIEGLGQVINLDNSPEVEFFRLVALVGG